MHSQMHSKNSILDPVMRIIGKSVGTGSFLTFSLLPKSVNYLKTLKSCVLEIFSDFVILVSQTNIYNVNNCWIHKQEIKFLWKILL